MNLDIYSNEIFCLLGHNGAGKTTTLNILTGMYNATSGTIYVNNLNLHNDLDKIRSNIGYCQQLDVY